MDLNGSPPALPPSQWLDRALASGYGAARTAFDAQPFLLIDLEAREALARGDSERLAGWLQHQPCPVIGLGAGAEDRALAEACDVIVDSRQRLASMLDNIGRAPLAAMTLVQVLRQTRDMPVAGALTLESLAYSALQAGPEFKRWSAAHPPAPGRVSGDPA